MVSAKSWTILTVFSILKSVVSQRAYRYRYGHAQNSKGRMTIPLMETRTAISADGTHCPGTNFCFQ